MIPGIKSNTNRTRIGVGLATVILALTALGIAIPAASAANSSSKSANPAGSAGISSMSLAGEHLDAAFEKVTPRTSSSSGLTVATAQSLPAASGPRFESVVVRSARVVGKVATVDLGGQDESFMVSAMLRAGNDFLLRLDLLPGPSEESTFSLDIKAPPATRVDLFREGIYLQSEANPASMTSNISAHLDSVHVGPGDSHLDIILHVPSKFGSGRYPIFFDITAQ